MPNVVRIYIPLWLDLLYEILKIINNMYGDLHSTMVRFIINHIRKGFSFS